MSQSNPTQKLRAATLRAVEPFDVEAFTLPARVRLTALAFLLSQTRAESDTEDDVFHGLSYLLDDVRGLLEKGGE